MCYITTTGLAAKESFFFPRMALLISASFSSSPLLSPPSKSSRSSNVVENPSPSLSDQLLPLSLTLLKRSSPILPQAPIWTNPSKPKPGILLPHRHPHSSSSSSALLVLKSLNPWQKTLRFFFFIQSKSPSSPLGTIFYNILLNSLRSGRQFTLAESMAAEMIRLAVPLDNITYSTLISCAKSCGRFSHALRWFDRLYRSGLLPDDITYSAVLDIYAELGHREDAFAFYERARAAGWAPDNAALSVLTKLPGGLQYALREVKALAAKPNVALYNALLAAAGRAELPGLARKLFDEMLASGLRPNERTLTTLVKIYGKARWGRDAVGLWERMRAMNWPADFILHNTLLSACAELGLEKDAEKLFGEMTLPDNFSFTAMIELYASANKADRALEVFRQMVERGVEPNVMSFTCLIRCLGKVGRIDYAVHIFIMLMKRGVKCDDRLCGCLLSLIAVSNEADARKLLGCLNKANPRLAGFVELMGSNDANFDEVRVELRGILNEADEYARKPFCNCLIDICSKKGGGYPPGRARELLRLGITHGLYSGLHAKRSEEWVLNLRSLSVGAACTAFEEWMGTLFDSIENGGALPSQFKINAGSGARSGLVSAIGSYTAELAAPFRQTVESGCLVAMKEDLISWLKSTRVI